MKLSIIIPAFNEEQTIDEVIEKIRKVKFPIDYEILVVNDGSTDNTYKNIKNLTKDKKQIEG